MESLQNIQRRIKGVKNISQITKAMELVAATKMRRSQEIALASRPYAFAALDLLANLSRLREERKLVLPPLLERRAVRRTCIALVTSDKGLAGSFNSAVIREFEKFLRRESIDLRSEDVSLIAVGQRAAAYLERRAALAAKFVRVGDYTSVTQTEPIAELLREGYLNKRWDRVLVFSTHFRTALRQDVLVREILPIDPENLERTAKGIIPEHGRFADMVREGKVSYFNRKTEEDYLIEPSPEEILSDLVRHLVSMQVYHLILEANASEHAARRVAMKSASDNAEELFGELSVAYNKSRQASITREIIEITAGAEALS